MFLKLVGIEDWVFLGHLKAEDQYQGSESAQSMIARYLMEHEDAVDERAELRGMTSGNVFVSWTAVHDKSGQHE